MGFFNGENFIKLQGKATKIKYVEYQNGGRFSCSLAVPVPGETNKFQYINVSVWGDMAEQLSEIKTGTWLKVYGHLEKRSYNTNCRYCNGDQKVFWTDVSIDNFMILNKD